MIYLNISLTKPSWWNRFENLYWKSGGTPFKHKCWEVQVTKDRHVLRFEFEFTINQDHAGLNVELGLFGYAAIFTIYDMRRWNEENNCWND